MGDIVLGLLLKTLIKLMGFLLFSADGNARVFLLSWLLTHEEQRLCESACSELIRKL